MPSSVIPRPGSRILALATFLSAVGSCGPERGPTLEQLREATSRYASVAAAEADGYVRDPLDTCETPYHLGVFEDLGVMGVHYLRRDLLGIDEDGTRLDATGTHTDFLQPGVLVYEPRPDSSLALVAVANVVSASAWAAAGHRAPPSYRGEPFAYVPENTGSGFAAHYDLHVWVHRENPSGVFAPYNPSVTCAYHVYDMPMIMPPDTPPDMIHH